jgi:hypothetical protein
MNELTKIGPGPGGGVQRIFMRRMDKKHLLLWKRAVLPLKTPFRRRSKKIKKKFDPAFPNRNLAGNKGETSSGMEDA